MSDQPDDAWLIALGTEVSDGKSVDWDLADRRATSDEARALVGNLKRLEQVVQAHRNTVVDSGAPPDAGPADATGHWHHLVLFESVGAGAFGTVYRAFDTRVDREVALKLVATGGSIARSPLSEARNLARIRHPNIVTVYGAEQDSDRVGIWMEFIQGETLAAMVQARGPMSAREVVGIGVDLCRALSALQGASLLHRDLKAHNVMREVGGRIVLMDFSGAWTSEAGETPANLSGTPLYMAPELFEGRPPSVASDIYSLGVLLFYLLSGRMPVDGATLAELTGAHVRQERVRLRDLRPELPEAVVQVVERASAHEPRERYQTAGELEHALVGTLGAYAAPQPSTLDAGDVNPARARRRRVGPWIPWTAAAAAALVATALALAGSPRPAAKADPMLIRFAITQPENTRSWPRLSPDGRLIVYGADVEGRDGLWVREMGVVDGRPIPSTSARETPFWSPDSRWLAFFDKGKLKRVALVGNAEPQIITEAPHPRGGDWNQFDVLLFATDSGLSRVNVDGTGLARVTTLDATRKEDRHGWPEFLPDGRRFLFVIRSTQSENSGVYLARLDAPGRKRIMPDYSRVAYSTAGYLLFAHDGALAAQAFDDRAEVLRGTPMELGPRLKYHPGGDGAFDVSGDVIIYRQSEDLPLTRLLILDREGHQVRPALPVGTYRHPRFSPDGTRIIMESLEQRSSNADLLLYDLTRSIFSPVIRNDAPDVAPTWSPDGTEIAFSSRRGARYETYTKVIDDVRPERLRPGPDGDKYVEDWTPDGALVETVMRNGLWRAPLSESGKPSLIRSSAVPERWLAEVSPDSQWIAYTSYEFGAPEVFVEPVARSDARYQVSAHGGAEPHWRADGRELFYVTSDSYVASVPVVPGKTWAAGKAQVLFRVYVPDPAGTSDYHVRWDGKLFVVNTIMGYPSVPPVQVVHNWTALLRR